MAAIDTDLVIASRLAATLRSPAALLRGLAARLSAPADTGVARARRAFVLEMIAGKPDAFSSELDVQAMMQHHPEHF